MSRPWSRASPSEAGARPLHCALAALLLSLGPTPIGAQESEKAMERPPPEILADDLIGVPLRLQDFTFPNHLVFGFAPLPAAPLGKGNWAAEIQYSRINHFQASPAAEDYLDGARAEGERRPLDAEDFLAILALPESDAFYFDGEMGITDLNFFWGLTDRLDVGIGVRHLYYTGGVLDGTIFDFHDQFGFGQQGRQYVADDQFQFAFAVDELDPIVQSGLPGASDGFSDPTVRFRYSFPRLARGWRFAIAAGVKIPMADEEDFLSTGNADYGVSVVADRRWNRTAFIVNLSVVAPGDFEQFGLDPPLLPSIHLSWIRRFQRLESTRFMIQLFAAEHPLRDLVDSDLTEGEFMMTVGMKWATPLGVVGCGLTENLLNHDNTPDIGMHFTWGILGVRNR